MQCPNCGRMNRPGANRCAYCGAMMTAQPQMQYGQPVMPAPFPGAPRVSFAPGNLDARQIGLGRLLLFIGFLCGIVTLGGGQFFSSKLPHAPVSVAIGTLTHAGLLTWTELSSDACAAVGAGLF